MSLSEVPCHSAVQAVPLLPPFYPLSKRFDTESLKWAYGMIGTIVGYWLKT
jgi:hypothetical protein